MVYLKHYLAVALLVVSVLWLIPNDGNPRIPPSPAAASEPSKGLEPISPLPRTIDLPAAKLSLGERLFRDTRLSRDDTIACSTCHDLNQGGTDRRQFSKGVGGTVGSINAPTVFNSGFNFVQFWDGRAATLEEQAAGPINNPIEMASNWEQVLTKLRADAGYRADFARIYPDGLTAINVADAIATFERSLVTPDSPFDRYLRGDTNALTADEREGYRRFKDYGCSSCHQGVNIGGNLFQQFGVMGDYFAGKRALTDADQGRYNVTRREEDRHVFKVPGLRNVALTAPYFHDGSAQTLEDAVAIMGRFQLGRELSDEDRRLIVAFLHTLTGRWKGQALQ